MNGDTLTGYIKILSAEPMSSGVIFKKTPQSEAVLYSPDEVLKYSAGNDLKYESHPLKIKGETLARRCFFKLLVDGKIRLYRLDYDITKTESLIVEYIKTFYFYQTDGMNRMQELREAVAEYEYRRTLRDAFSEQCSVEGHYSFDDQGLSLLISEYNKCINSPALIYVTETTRNNRWLIGGSVGLLRSSISPGHSAFSSFESNGGMGYHLNALLEFTITRSLSCRGGISLFKRTETNTKQHVVTEFYDNEGEVFNLESYVSLNQFVVPLTVKYALLKTKVTPYLALGGYGGIEARNTSRVDKLNFHNVNGQSLQYVVRSNEPIEQLNFFEIGWTLSGGIEFPIMSGSAFLEILATGGNNEKDKTSSDYISNMTLGAVIGYMF